MNNMIEVTIPVEPEAAEALADTRNRHAVGRLISRIFSSRSGPSPLAQAIAALEQHQPDWNSPADKVAR